MTQQNTPGYFIVLEGIDATGKTTMAGKITQWFRDHGVDPIHTREPGGTPAAEQLREKVLWGAGESADDWCNMTEALLYLASRVQHTEVLIKPSLQEGRLVFCERYYDSTYAHQGGGRKIDVPTLKALHKLTIGEFKPDLIILLDGDPEVLRKRMLDRVRLDRLEQTGLDFQVRSRAIHLEQVHEDPGRYLVVNTECSIDEVFAQIEPELQRIVKYWHQKNLL
jgi:dTMP kinase